MELMEDEPEIKTIHQTQDTIKTKDKDTCCIVEDISQQIEGQNINKTEFIMPTSMQDMQKIKTILTEHI
jgi:predicted DNA binding protein